jgi:NitT/TauT family transport system permease protein
MRYLKGSLFVLLFWYLSAYLVASPIIPFPHAVFDYLISFDTTGGLHVDLVYSLYRIVVGLGIALSIATPVGMLIGRSRALDSVISPALYLLYPLPKIAFLPVFMVLFGIGDLSKIVLIAVIVFFPAVVSIRDGVRGIPHQYLELARAYRLSPRQMIGDIIWPAVLPRIFSSVRITLGISLSVLFISESYAASHGLGYAIMNSWVMADYVAMYGGIVVLSMLGLSLYAITDSLEHLLVHHGKTA